VVDPVEIKITNDQITQGVSVSLPLGDQRVIGTAPDTRFVEVADTGAELVLSIRNRGLVEEALAGTDSPKHKAIKLDEFYRRALVTGENELQKAQLARKRNYIKSGAIDNTELPDVRANMALVAGSEVVALTLSDVFLQLSHAFPTDMLHVPGAVSAIGAIVTAAAYIGINVRYLFPSFSAQYIQRKEIKAETGMFGRIHEYFPLADKLVGYGGRIINALALWEKPIATAAARRKRT
jgi:hypothetical protein